MLSLTKLILADLTFATMLLAQDVGTVGGQVHDITGAPIPATIASLEREATPRIDLSEETEKRGEFQFTRLPPGTYTLNLSQPGFRSLTVTSIRVVAGAQNQLPPLRLDVSVNCVDPSPNYLELLPHQQSGNLQGRVVREQKRYPGPAIVRATVDLLCDGGKICGQTVTNSAGEFMFVGISPGEDYAIRVTHPSYYLLEEQHYEVQAGFNSVYWPMSLEYCPNGNCDPKLRPKRPLGLCE